MARKKILFVDDEEEFLDIMSQRIEYWGYDVIPAHNAEEAMKAFKEEKPDAIILDYLMPDINGTQLLMRIRAIDMKVPVIMFTASPEPGAMEDTTKLNIVAFVPKLTPFADAQQNLKAALNMAFKGKDDKGGK